MTDNSARLGLPYLLTGQAQKEVTHNEALDRLDAAVQLVVLDRGLSQPPADAVEGSAYVVAAGASGAWAGKDGQVAAWYGGWQFLVPRQGWLAWVADEDVLIRHTGGGWTVLLSGLGQTVAAAPDAAAIRATLGLGSAALLSAEQAAGGATRLVHAFAFGDATPAALGTIPAGALVSRVSLTVLTAFDGGGAALAVGDAGNSQRFLAAARCDPAQAATYTTSPGQRLAADTAVVLAITPGAGATAGSGLLIVDYASG